MSTKQPPKSRAYLRKLTTSQIAEARTRYKSEIPKPTINRLAQLYNVGRNTMWRILNSPLEPSQLGR